MDIIQRLRELRQSSESSVVIGDDDTSQHERLPYTHALEEWLVHFILDQVTDPGGVRFTLVVLAGNAGDGKSYLLREIRRKLVAHHLSPDTVRWLLDATESDSPAEGSEQRLANFFEPLADTADWTKLPLHIAAMNTGAATRFIDYCKKHQDYGAVRDILSVQLAIDPVKGEKPEVFWRRYDRVLVIDLDRRMLVPLTAAESPPRDGTFIYHVFEAVSTTNPGSVIAGAPLQCDECPARLLCPIRANLQALSNSVVRQRISTLLLDITLEERIHIGPRALWHLMYLMTLGGLDAIQVEASRPLPTCSDISDLDGNTRARSLFFSSLFDVREPETASVLSAMLGELKRVDPGSRFTLSSHEAALSASISCEEDALQAEAISARLGLSASALCGPRDDANARALMAMRRSFFFDEPDPDPVRHNWLRQWAAFLEKWRDEILNGHGNRPESAQVLVDVLKQLFASAGRSDFVRLDLPWRSKQELYTRLVIAADRRTAVSDSRVLAPDHERPGSTRMEIAQLSRNIDAYPLAVVASLRDGPKVRITWPLFRLLQRVKQQSYLPLSLSPERVQHLERVGASLGATAAFQQGVAVRDAEKMQLCLDEGGMIDVIEF